MLLRVVGGDRGVTLDELLHRETDIAVDIGDVAQFDAGSVVKSANSFLFSSPDMRSTITAGAWREIFWDGIMMYTMDAAVSSISLKNCFTGEIRILLISPIHRMNWRV